MSWGWILAGIYAHEDLTQCWLFKGGTCLKKCFFETYRFSEDLDLPSPIRNTWTPISLRPHLLKLAPEFTNRLYRNSG